jgi:hypothetical protein
MGALVNMDRKSDLVEVIGARRTSSRFTGHLNGGAEHHKQDSDYRNDDE